MGVIFKIIISDYILITQLPAFSDYHPNLKTLDSLGPMRGNTRPQSSTSVELRFFPEQLHMSESEKGLYVMIFSYNDLKEHKQLQVSPAFPSFKIPVPLLFLLFCLYQ